VTAMTAMTVRLLHAAGDALGEGPHWCHRERCLLRVDIPAGAVHRLAADGVPGASIRVGEPIGCVVPRRVGGWLIATASGIHELDASGATTLLANPEADRPGNRFNDGKCDALGRFWVGSLAMDGAPGAGALWRIGTDGTPTRMIDGVDVANGLGWSPDGTWLYFTDSGKGTIHRYAFDPASGSLGERTRFAQLCDGGVPDGLTVDADGFVWSAIWDGARLLRFDPDGVLERTVELPVPRPTSCAFGGEHGRTLYITSARVGLDTGTLERAPDSGGVFTLDSPVAGLPETAFGAGHACRARDVSLENQPGGLRCSMVRHIRVTSIPRRERQSTM